MENETETEIESRHWQEREDKHASPHRSRNISRLVKEISTQKEELRTRECVSLDWESLWRILRIEINPRR